MAKPANKKSIPEHRNSEVNLLTWLATCISVISFLFYFQAQQILLYGDAVAHINIARRVFDSKTPGLLQLGTVWLPLPHLLIMPFVVSTELWRRGAGGSIPSLIAYVFGVVGMFRLVRSGLSRGAQPDAPARIAAWIAAIVYAANPNLIYMQTTAMGESLYLAFFIWGVVYFVEAIRGTENALTKCGLCLAAACLTRYDGWFLSVAMVSALAIYSFVRSQQSAAAMPTFPGPRALAKFVLIAAAAPALWLAYNGIVYRNPLEFENGPYSAKAIEARSQSSGSPGHPGTNNLALAGMYFLKSAEVNLSENQWLQRIWVAFIFAAALVVFLPRKTPAAPPAHAWPLLFLLIPIPFYALSIAYGGVPIFVPPWWPFTHYNVRYGLELLPAFAVGLAVIVYLLLSYERWKLRFRLAAALALLLFVFTSYISIWRVDPICLQEAEINMRTRNGLEAQLAVWLEKLPSDCTLLMYLGDHVGALQQAGIPLKHVINEGNHRVWMHPADPNGLWERALADPTRYADYIVAFEGDPVWQAVHDRHFNELVEIHVTGQSRAVLYQLR